MQKEDFIDVADSGIWAYSNLDIDDQGFVTGSAYTYEKDGYDVQISVTSYEFSRHGKTETNHVPHIVVTDNGSVVLEPEARDSINPSQAITNAIGTAEMVWKNLEEYI